MLGIAMCSFTLLLWPAALGKGLLSGSCIVTQCLYTSTLYTSSTLLTEFLPQYAPKSITISGITRYTPYNHTTV